MTDRQNDGAGRPPKPGVSGARAATTGVLEPTHAAIRSRLSDYLDGSLTDAEQLEIRRHLDECAGCLAFWRTFLKVIDATGRLPRHHVSPDSTQRLLEHVASGAHGQIG